MIQPVLQDETFLADVSRASGEPGLHIWWLGQSGFLISYRGKSLLVDPYLSDSLTRKYAGTDRPHIRMTERVIAPEKLNFIGIVTSSHNHTDHLDGDTIRPLLASNPNLSILVSQANREFAAERLQISPQRLNGISIETPVSLGGFTFHAVPSAHEQLETDANGDHKYIGLVIQAGRWVIYHSGDTVYYEGMETWLQKWQIDVALLPINGRDPKRGVAGNLSGPEAVRLARLSNLRLVVPCHYEMFEFNTASPGEFIEAARQAGQGYHLLKCGERLSLERTL